MRRVAVLARQLGRVLSLALLAALSCTALMRYAPGYFTDSHEVDAAHAAHTRAQLDALQQTEGSLPSLLKTQLQGWLHGDLGTSRHYEVPVAGLLRERCRITLSLLLRGISIGWLLALALALPLSARRGSQGEVVIAASMAALLAIPVGALATVCLLLNKGGPVFVLALLIAARDFKLLYRIVRSSWVAPHVLHARAQGFSLLQTARVHLAAVLGREIAALALMSFIVALSALVPVEVVFDVPGLGQLAWTAALNRDLPVLVAVTALLAACVGLAGLFATSSQVEGAAQCA